MTGKDKPFLLDRRSVRIGLFLIIPLVIFVLVSAAIRVSSYGIDHTVVVLGQKELVRNSPAALRVSLIADSGDYYLPTNLSGRLVRGDEQHELFDGGVDRVGYASAKNFVVPNMTPGPAKLVLSIEFDERGRTVTSDVTVVASPKGETLILPEDVKEKPLPNPVLIDGGELRVFTEDRGAPTGLMSVLFCRATDAAGSPLATALEIEPHADAGKEKTKESIRTDALGLFALPAKPLELSWPIRVMGSRSSTAVDIEAEGDASPEAAENPGAYLFPKIVYAGMSALVKNSMPNKGDPLNISARQLSNEGPAYVDFFKEGVWVQAASSWFSGGAIKVAIVPRFEGFGRVQVTSSVMAPGRTIAVRNVYVLSETESEMDGLRAVLEKLKESEVDGEWAKSALALPLEQGTGFDHRLAAAFALARSYEGHAEIKTLINSRSSDDTELGSFKERFQRMVMLAILLIGVGIAALIALLAVRARATQKHVAAMILSDDSDLDPTQIEDPKLERIQAIIQTAVLFLIILGAFVAVAVLVDTLAWAHI